MPSSKLIYISLTGFSALLIGIGMGRFGYQPLIPIIVGDHWFSISQADYLMAANLSGYVLGSALSWRINYYIPTVTLIRFCMGAVILSFIGCAFPLPFISYGLLRLLAGFSGGIIMVLAAPTIFKFVDPSKKGLVGGIIFSGVGIGIALSGTLIPLLVKAGLLVTWLSYAAFSSLLMLTFFRGWPEGANKKHVALIEKRDSELKLNRAIFLLMISYACNAIGFIPHTVFWVDYIARGLNLGIATANHMWILLGISAAFGPLVTGLLADKIGFAKSIRASLLVKGAGVMLPIFSSSPWALVISSVFTGSLALGISSLAAGRVSELIPEVHQKKVWGWITIAFSITYAGGAYVLSYIFKITASYHLLFIIGGCMLLIGSILDYLSSLSRERNYINTYHE